MLAFLYVGLKILKSFLPLYCDRIPIKAQCVQSCFALTRRLVSRMPLIASPLPELVAIW